MIKTNSLTKVFRSDEEGTRGQGTGDEGQVTSDKGQVTRDKETRRLKI